MPDLELVRSAAKSITSLDDVIRFLRPQAPAPAQVVLPPAAIITADEKAALERLPRVFGSVVPTERRDLKTEEVTKLHEERATLDVLEKMIKERKEAIRTTVLNALDVQFEAKADPGPGAARDKDGHYLQAGSINIPETHQRFSWEVSGGSVDVDPETLLAVADDPEVAEISHQDYLDVTTPVRVVDISKFLAKLKEKPEVLIHTGAFVKQGSPRGALNIRKQR